MNGFIILKNTKLTSIGLQRHPLLNKSENIQVLLGTDNYEVVVFKNCDTLVAIAEDENIIVVFSGYLQYPLPNWAQGTPVDSARNSATYLMDKYLVDGEHFLQNINGRYGVVLFDKRRELCISATDNKGYRRLFYHQSDDKLVVSTHLSLLMNSANKEIAEKIDSAFFLSYEFLPEQKTIYPKVKYISPYNYLLLSSEATLVNDKVVSTHKKVKYSYNDFDDVVNNLYEKFMLAIENQCPTNEKIAVLLGGFDSALIASVLKKKGKDIETFSFYYEDVKFNQKYTDSLAEYLGIKHTWIKLDSEILSHGIKIFDQVFNSPTSLAHYLIYSNYAVQVIRDNGYKYCITGDGCDELFLGYPTVYRRARLFNIIGKAPKVVTDALRLILSLNPFEKIFGHVGRLARTVMLIMSRDMPARGFVANRILDEYSLARVSSDFSSISESDIEKKLESVASNYQGLNAIRLAYKGKSIVGTNRNKTEGVSLYNGVVVQSPYYDEEFLAYAESIPDDLIRPVEHSGKSDIGKYVLVEMAKKYKLLPEEVIIQKKASPVTSPVDDWYKYELLDSVLGSCDSFPYKLNKRYLRDIMNYGFLDRLFRKKSLSHYVMHIPSLIVTYSSFFRKYK